jgi:hypothetical protein
MMSGHLTTCIFSTCAAFTTSYGNIEFTMSVMPCGLCGAPATFQHMMDNVFGHPAEAPSGKTLSFSLFVAVHLDEICIFSTGVEDHLLHIRLGLSRLRTFHLHAKPSKCEWMQNSIHFLGHHISSKGRQAGPKVNALQSWPIPTNRAELRALLGSFGYWRRAGYEHTTVPLNALTQRCVAQSSTRHAYQTLKHKQALLTSPVLLRPDQDKPFVDVTDASNFAVGASMEQSDDHDRLRCP